MSRPIAVGTLLVLAACGRSSVFIGRVPHDGSVEPSDGSPPAVVPDAADAPGSDRPAAVCVADPPPPAVPAAPWNCGPRCFQDDNVPLDTSFSLPADPAPANRPALVYPLASSTHPVNLTDLTVQWRRAGPAQAAFRVRVATSDPTRRYELRLPCRPPPTITTQPAIEECTYALPRSIWGAIAAENAGGPVDIAIDASDRAAGTVATSSSVRISFTPAALGGGAYFWSDTQSTSPTAAREGRILRGFIGGGAAQTFILPNTPANRFTCGGCHTASRDGRTIGFTAEQDGFLTVSRADNPGAPLVAPPDPPQPDSSTLTLSPDGGLVLVSYGSGGNDGRIVVRSTVDGHEVARLDPSVLGTAERKIYFPDWSPDGTEVVATLATRSERPWAVNDGVLAVIPYNGGAFGPARVIVPRDGALFHFYPSYSPDGVWIVFASAPLGGKSYDNPQSRLRLVRREGGTIHELGNATQGLGKRTSWPRFVPFRQAGCQLYFITLNSRMDYGYVLENSIIAEGGWSQLWLAAIDVRKLPGDPSSAPVWLPFQDPRHKNLRGTWVERLQCGAQSPCGDGAVCAAGQCVPAQN